MVEQFTIDVLYADGRSDKIVLSVSMAHPRQLSCTGLGMHDRVVGEDDLFDALVALRNELYAMGCLLLCAGARPDVYPSGVARSMSGGRMAYVCEIGKSAHAIVDIFSPALAEEVGTVEEQESYRQSWISALRSLLLN